MASDRGYAETVLDKFELLYTLGSEAQNCPVGRSPACSNVVAYPGRVATRPGFSNVASFASLLVVALKEYVLPDVSSKRLLALTSDGFLRQETGSYSFVTIATGFTEAAISARMLSVTQFGREYFALNDSGKIPYAMPKSWDDTNVDEVAPAGPGAGPTLVEGAAGAVVAGTHQVRICFLTRSGHMTPPGPATSLSCSGTKTISVSNIPIGPSWVQGRIIAISPAGSADVYYIAGSAMHLGDNTTTSVSNINFSDSTLIAGTPISVADDPSTDSMNLIALPSQAGVGTYHDRLCWFGERNAFYRIGDFGPLGLNFNGGWISNAPLGWTTKISGGMTKGNSTGGAYGDYLVITGDGTNAKAEIENSEPILRWPRIRPGVELRCRVRIRHSGATQGTFHIWQSTTAAGNNVVGGMTVNFSALSNSEWRVLDGQVTAAASFTPGSTATIRIASGGTGVGTGTAINNGGQFLIDYIELYHGDKPYSYSNVRWSRPGQPDAYDDAFGVMVVGLDDGQAIRRGFTIGDNYYFAKERSLYETRDDGSSEPGQWQVSPVSHTVGTPSQMGVGHGDQWVVIASRSGLYFFSGGTPIPLTADIQDTWNTINWQYGNLVWVEVDNEQKRIYVGVPYAGSTTVNKILKFQWWGSSPIASAFAGSGSEVQANLWSFSDGQTIPCGTLSERSNGKRDFVIGTAHTSNNLARFDSTALSDTVGAGTLAINSTYRTAAIGITGHRELTGQLVINAKGSGTMTIVPYMTDGVTAMSSPGIPSLVLANPPKQDQEYRAIRVVAPRAFWEFNTNAAGSWFSLQKLALMSKEKPYTGELGKRSYA